MDGIDSVFAFVDFYCSFVEWHTRKLDALKAGAQAGGPFVPSLFILDVDVLSRILRSIRSLGLIDGIGQQKEFNDILSLQFVDDTLLFCAGRLDSMLMVKAILLAFEEVSGLKINFHKSSVIYLNMEDSDSTLIASWLNCK